MGQPSKQVDWITRLAEAVRSVTGPGMISLHQPEFSGNEWKYLKDCLDSTFVSSVGAYVDRFESDLAAYTGAKHAVAVVNGTAALHVALLMAGVQTGDEVLVPALTFVATANAVHQAGGVPHFVDVSRNTLGMDAEALAEWLGVTAEISQGGCRNRETGRQIKAVVPMHTFGHPCDMEGICKVAGTFHLAVVEDAAESLGSMYGNRHPGTLGLAGAISFNGNKTITTGGGGAILTNDPTLAKKAKHITTTAKVPHRWEYVHDVVGFNYRMPNLNAALGCAQLEQLPRLVNKKRLVFERYRNALAGIAEVELFAEPVGCISNYWLQAVLLKETEIGQKDLVLATLNDQGLMARPAWRLMHRLEPYRGNPKAPLPVSEELENRLINIPSSAFLSGVNRIG